jgi:hypothetical protein
MSLRTIIRIAVLAAASIGGNQALCPAITVDEFRRELVGMRCGTPTTGPLAGKARCAPCTCPTAPQCWPARG